ncbi:uncharacterized protein LOC131945087 [Physella acuta]|uniref:uncharacterized protein LOC131945087 n=1 Tax=Physella acuta TaxID=109671 RepID=UPI0027DCC78F|nr:uncharacterized protein LOC131945087 [Physella acuta]
MNLHLMFTVLFLPVILTISTASRMVFEANPSVIHQILTKELKMRCAIKYQSWQVQRQQRAATMTYRPDTSTVGYDFTTTETPSSTGLTSFASSAQVDISHVTSIIINKINPATGSRETVASVTPFDPASSEGRYQENLRVEGSGTTSPVPGELGYLQLTWDSPVADQAGTYTCEVFALNGEKHSVYLNGSIHVDATEPTVADLVKYIIIHQNLVEDLQEENRQLQHELMDLKFNITLPLYHELMNIKQSIEEMKNTVNLHSAEISFLAENLHNLTTPVNVTTATPLQVSPTVPVVS